MLIEFVLYAYQKMKVEEPEKRLKQRGQSLKRSSQAPKISIKEKVTPIIEILVYDIPARWKEDQIIKIFKNLGLVKKISIKNQFKYKSVKLTIHLKLDQEKAEWRNRYSINMKMEDKVYWFQWFPASMKLSEIRDRFKFVAYKEIKEDWRNLSEADILEKYKEQGGWFYAKFEYGLAGRLDCSSKEKNFNTFISSRNDNSRLVNNNDDSKESLGISSHKENSSELKYTEKEVMEIVEKAIEDQLKEKEMFKENVSKTAREIASMMGLRIDNIDFSVSSVNKDRQTEVLFKEIQKANAEKLINEQKSKSPKVTPSVNEEEVVDLVNRYRKGAFSSRSLGKSETMKGHVTEDEVIDVIMDVRKKSTTGEVPVSQEEVDLYNKVNQACSSRLPPEIKKEKILVDEKVGHKRGNQEELSRGIVSSDGTDEESGSEKTPTVVAKKEKSAQ
uniref:RRM domain-containing protein n=1 Tax=Rhizophagus irregularis (strain DAOM 181602 / DAOM 197198 / MUCL 43194) TaxID=747089 RepID=U9U8Q0_RHIID